MSNVGTFGNVMGTISTSRRSAFWHLGPSSARPFWGKLEI